MPTVISDSMHSFRKGFVAHGGPTSNVLLHAGIIYEIGQRTAKANYLEDESLYRRIKVGFRFRRIHDC